MSPDDVLLKLNQLNIIKACGFYYVPAKLLKIGASAIYTSLAPIINASIASSIYPNECTESEIFPLYKKSDNLAKINYGPLIILTSLSKVTDG